MLPSFIDILRTLSPQEERLLDGIARGDYYVDDPAPDDPVRVEGAIYLNLTVPFQVELLGPLPRTPEARILAELDRRHSRLRVGLANLQRLGLIAQGPHGRSDPLEGMIWAPTLLGVAFVAACRGNRASGQREPDAYSSR